VPSLTPSPGPSTRPDASVSPSPVDGASPEPFPGRSPEPDGSTGAGGPPGGPSATPPPGDGGLVVSGANAPPFGLVDISLGGFDNLEWAVPAMTMTVPGLLLMLAVLAQLSTGAVWLPVVRRWLGAFGIGRRRRSKDIADPEQPSS
jgi:hypothetical protein